MEETEKLYKREFTVTLYSDNPDEIPTMDEFHEILDDHIGCKGVDICTTEHRWAHNTDDNLYCCEIESLYITPRATKCTKIHETT